jgi:hypothetical protein
MTVGKYFPGFVHFETDSVVVTHIAREMAVNPGGMQPDGALVPDIQVRHDIGIAIGAHGCCSAAECGSKNLLDLGIAHHLVRPSKLAADIRCVGR